MHIPDGYLSNPVCLVTTAAACAALGASMAVARRAPKPTGALPLAATAAAVFAGQMVNFPVGQGTSGHLVGAALATIMLGPAAALLAMTAVLATQCLMFGDGGLTALGANTLNMAVCGVLVTALILRFAASLDASRGQKIAAAGVAGWSAVMAGALLCSLELAVSGAESITVVLPAMLGAHVAIGLGEAAITMSVLALLTSPGIAVDPAPAASRRSWLGVLCGCGLATVLAPLASPLPDGLERIAEDLQFADSGRSWIVALAPDYVTPGVAWPPLAIALAGLLGVACAFALAYAVGRPALRVARKNK